MSVVGSVRIIVLDVSSCKQRKQQMSESYASRSRPVEISVIPLTAMQDRRSQTCYSEESYETALERDKSNRESMIRRLEIMVARGHFDKAVALLREYQQDYESEFIKGVDPESSVATIFDCAMTELLDKAGYKIVRAVANATPADLLGINRLSDKRLALVVQTLNRHKIRISSTLESWYKTYSKEKSALRNQFKTNKFMRRRKNNA